LKLKSIEQAGRGFVSIAQMNRNLSIPSKLRVSVHLSDWKLRIAAYRVDRKGAGNDFEIDPNPEHGFEIFNWLLISGSIQSVS